MIRIGNNSNPSTIALSNNKYGRVYKGDSLYWRKINRATYDLTVVGGSGSGTYRKNEIVPIVASVPEGYEFTEWTGDIQWITDLESSNTTITMPAANISIEATYELIPAETVTIGGEVYETVTIGTQTWLKRNLHYNDSGGGIYAYASNEANVATYGRLYTWDAAVRVAATVTGWHLPSQSEWITLRDYLGGTFIAGGKLKEAGTMHWVSPNKGATNESGFTALGGGNSAGSNHYSGRNNMGFWWSSTDMDYNYKFSVDLSAYTSNMSIGTNQKIAGFSVRLIKD